MPCKKCKDGKYKWGNTGECKYDTIKECEEANKDYYEKTTSIVELVIEDDNEALAIDAISLVSAPAIEQDFVYFGKEKHNLTFAKVDEEKRMLVSPALIPNKQIFRYDPNTDSEYYVYFSPETVRQASELYLKHNNHHKATHEHNERVSGVLTVESWIIEDPKMDKSKVYGYNLPKGTWMVKMRVDNDDLWQKVKSGELRGLSIEGYFVDKMQKMSERQPTDQEILSALNEIIRETNKPQKVELALVDDLKDLIKRGLSIEKKLANQITSYNGLLRAGGEFKKKYGNLVKQAKELGVDVPSELKKLEEIAEGFEKKGNALKKVSNLFS